ncbi:MAG TPA: hypothetical protein VK283_04165, partial [Acidimicrobiales bacterium]|nr:hypothetical protein [Acidimicrobiales bacterium]
MNRIPASATTSITRRRLRGTGKLNALTVSIAVVLGLVAAPIISALTAGPAGAVTAISAVGALATNTGTGPPPTTLADNPQHVGDVMVVTAEPGAATPTLASVSGGGVTTWNKGAQFAGTTEPRDVEIWYGTVTATGAATITFNWS